MWIIVDGKKRSIKSITFSYLKEKILDGSKQQTCRVIAIPYYSFNELVAIVWEKEEILFLAPIISYYPKKINEVNEKEAIRDGFSNKEEFSKKLCEMHNINDDHYGFLINWDYEKRIMPSHFDGKYWNFLVEQQSIEEVGIY